MAKQQTVLVEPDGQAKFFEMPNPFDLELWDTYGDYLAGHGRELDKEHDRFAAKFDEECGWFNWDVGDWLLEGEDGGLPMKELRLRAEIKFEKRHRTWKTMRNWKVTARAFRQVDGEPSRRRDGREGRAALSYSQHQLVEQFPPETQDMLLDVALERNYGHNGLKEHIRNLRKSGQLLPAKDKPIVTVDDAKYATIRVSLRKAHCAFLKAVKPTGSAGLTAAYIIQEYIEANLEALVARAVKQDARWGTVPRDVLANRAEKWERVNWPEPLPGLAPMLKSSEPQK